MVEGLMVNNLLTIAEVELALAAFERRRNLMGGHARHHFELVLADGSTNATFVVLRDGSESLLLLGRHFLHAFRRSAALITRAGAALSARPTLHVLTAAATAIYKVFGDVFAQLGGRIEEHLTQFARVAGRRFRAARRRTARILKLTGVLFGLILRLNFQRLIGNRQWLIKVVIQVGNHVLQEPLLARKHLSANFTAPLKGRRRLNGARVLYLVIHPLGNCGEGHTAGLTLLGSIHKDGGTAAGLALQFGVIALVHLHNVAAQVVATGKLGIAVGTRRHIVGGRCCGRQYN